MKEECDMETFEAIETCADLARKLVLLSFQF